MGGDFSNQYQQYYKTAARYYVSESVSVLVVWVHSKGPRRRGTNKAAHFVTYRVLSGHQTT